MKSPTIARPKLTTQTDAVIYFFTLMDHEMISDLLLDGRDYQEMPKSLFINKLSVLFDTFKSLGDRHLVRSNRIDGEFNGGNVTAITYIGNVSHNFVDILFEIDDQGFITDMYEFEDADEDEAPVYKEGRLFIDNFAFNEEDEDDYDSNDDYPF